MSLFKKEVEVYIIGDHEVVHKVINCDWMWKCRRCKEVFQVRKTFESKDCHSCNCDKCTI